MFLYILKGKMPFKMYKIIFFPEKKKEICVSTLPKIFRPVIRNALIFIWPHFTHTQRLYIDKGLDK